jgi:hypothetical protein
LAPLAEFLDEVARRERATTTADCRLPTRLMPMSCTARLAGDDGGPSMAILGRLWIVVTHDQFIELDARWSRL